VGVEVLGCCSSRKQSRGNDLDCILKGISNSRESSKLNLVFNNEKIMLIVFTTKKIFLFHGKYKKVKYSKTAKIFSSKVVVVEAINLGCNIHNIFSIC